MRDFTIRHPELGMLCGTMECPDRGRVPVFTGNRGNAQRFITENEAEAGLYLLTEVCSEGTCEGLEVGR